MSSPNFADSAFELHPHFEALNLPGEPMTAEKQPVGDAASKQPSASQRWMGETLLDCGDFVD